MSNVAKAGGSQTNVDLRIAERLSVYYRNVLEAPLSCCSQMKIGGTAELCERQSTNGSAASKCPRENNLEFKGEHDKGAAWTSRCRYNTSHLNYCTFYYPYH